VCCVLDIDHEFCEPCLAGRSVRAAADSRKVPYTNFANGEWAAALPSIEQR
jgi:hypothetical protein